MHGVKHVKYIYYILISYHTILAFSFSVSVYRTPIFVKLRSKLYELSIIKCTAFKFIYLFIYLCIFNFLIMALHKSQNMY